MSVLALSNDDPQLSLDQARCALEHEPDNPRTWLRLAHAYRALRRWDDALGAYQRLESIQPIDAPDRAKRLTEFGTLLLNQFHDPAAARDKFLAVMGLLQTLVTTRAESPTDRVAAIAAALATPAGHDAFAKAAAGEPAYAYSAIFLAQSEIRAGQGAVGYDLIRQVLESYPTSIEALLVEGEYHIRSNHWPQARDIYTRVLAAAPTNYDALIGFHEICVQSDSWTDAMAAWNNAVHQSRPGTGERLCFQSFLVWAAACAGNPRAADAAADLLRVDPNNQFACFARALTELRAAKIDQAYRWARTARLGLVLPLTRAAERAAATIQLMLDRAQLPPEAQLIVAGVYWDAKFPEKARAAYDAYIRAVPDSPWRDVLDDLQILLNPAESPASAPASSQQAQGE